MTAVFRRVVLAPAVVVLTALLLTTIPVWLLLAAVLSPVLPGRLRPLRLMWIALNEVYGGDPRLTDFNLPQLVRRAEEQRAGLEQQRLAAARASFAEEHRVGGTTG